MLLKYALFVTFYAAMQTFYQHSTCDNSVSLYYRLLQISQGTKGATPKVEALSTRSRVPQAHRYRYIRYLFLHCLARINKRQCSDVRVLQQPLHTPSRSLTNLTPNKRSSQCYEFLHGIRTVILDRNFIDFIVLGRPLLNTTEAHGAGKWNGKIRASLELGRI